MTAPKNRENEAKPQWGKYARIAGNPGLSIQDQISRFAPTPQMKLPAPPGNQQGTDITIRKGPNRNDGLISTHREERPPYPNYTEKPQPPPPDATEEE